MTIAFRPDAEFFPGFVRDTGLKAYNIVAELHAHLDPGRCSGIRASYNRSYIYQSDPRENTDFNIERELGIPNIPASGRTNGFPWIAIAGYSPVGDMTNNPLIQPDNLYQLGEQPDDQSPKHTLKIGFDVRKVRSDRTQGLTVRGQFNFENNNPVGSRNSMADFLLGLPQQSVVGNRAWTIRMRNYRTGLVHAG